MTRISMSDDRNPGKYVAEYPYLVSWGCRRPARPIHPPAVVQHLGYWIADIKANDENNLSRRERLFARFCELVEKTNQFHCETRFIFVENGSLRRRYQTCRLRSDDWHSLPVRMTLELHQEYVTVSTIIELSQLEDKIGTDMSLVGPLKSALAKLRKVATERYEELSSKASSGERPGPMPEVRKALKGPYREIFLKLWDEFYDQVLNKPVADMGDIFEGLFADFRGLVATSTDGAFFAKGTPAPERTKAPRRFTSNESIHRAHVILPFMTAEPDMGGTGGEKEVTISRVLDGRCIHASTLGAQLPENEASGAQPLTYLVLTTGINSWQIGRLVDRFHTLSSVRLAARRFYGRLDKAGDDLHELEKSLLENIDPLLWRMIVGEERTTSRDAIAQVMKKLFQDASTLHKIRDDISGGLPYRVERSRYYRTQFKSILSGLRIGPRGRIEGFQTYDEFVERRFGSAYDFIDMVGKRFDRLEQQLSTGYQRVRTAEAARLQEDTEQKTEAIEHFQSTAELGFFWVLFPYYVGHSLFALLSPVVMRHPLVARYSSVDDTRAQWELVFTLLSFIAGWVCLKLLRRRKQAKKNKRKQEIWDYFNPDKLADESSELTN